MTLETQLRSAMAEAVAPAHPDTDHLVALARRRGLAIRRRRQALSVVGPVGAVGAVIVALLSPTLVADRHPDRHPGQVVLGTPTAPSTPDLRSTTPFTGRSTAAALLYAVDLSAAGRATDFRGQGGTGPGPETYATFRFAPSGSTTAGDVGINVQPGFAGRGARPGDAAVDQLTACQRWMEECTTTRRADGSQLTVYRDRSDYHGGRGVRQVVELFRTDGVRIVASASNGLDVTERDEQVTRDQPVLSIGQLVAVVTQPWWGARLPSYFTDQGGALASYVEIGGAAQDAPSASPTP
jgi:hypothetical protein